MGGTSFFSKIWKIVLFVKRNISSLYSDEKHSSLFSVSWLAVSSKEEGGATLSTNTFCGTTRMVWWNILMALHIDFHSFWCTLKQVNIDEVNFICSISFCLLFAQPGMCFQIFFRCEQSTHYIAEITHLKLWLWWVEKFPQMYYDYYRSCSLQNRAIPRFRHQHSHTHISLSCSWLEVCY